MKLSIDHLTDTPSQSELVAEPGWWQGMRAALPELPERLEDDFRFEVRAHRMGQDLFLEGRVTGEIELGCGRCLSRYRHALREDFRLVLEPAGERVPTDPDGVEQLARDGVWFADDLDSGWFQGHELDLSTFIREVIALALPVQPLCREDCKGLCPRCGVDRNIEQCECGPVRRHSPFAVLEAAKRGSERG
jgi:uncharacterized protein